jgi:hypothetical protein
MLVVNLDLWFKSKVNEKTVSGEDQPRRSTRNKLSIVNTKLSTAKKKKEAQYTSTELIFFLY